jgi:hypothetical protein
MPPPIPPDPLANVSATFPSMTQFTIVGDALLQRMPPPKDAEPPVIMNPSIINVLSCPPVMSRTLALRFEASMMVESGSGFIVVQLFVLISKKLKVSLIVITSGYEVSESYQTATVSPWLSTKSMPAWMVSNGPSPPTFLIIA